MSVLCTFMMFFHSLINPLMSMAPANCEVVKTLFCFLCGMIGFLVVKQSRFGAMNRAKGATKLAPDDAIFATEDLAAKTEITLSTSSAKASLSTVDVEAKPSKKTLDNRRRAMKKAERKARRAVEHDCNGSELDNTEQLVVQPFRALLARTESTCSSACSMSSMSTTTPVSPTCSVDSESSIETKSSVDCESTIEAKSTVDTESTIDEENGENASSEQESNKGEHAISEQEINDACSDGASPEAITSSSSISAEIESASLSDEEHGHDEVQAVQETPQLDDTKQSDSPTLNNDDHFDLDDEEEEDEEDDWELEAALLRAAGETLTSATPRNAEQAWQEDGQNLSQVYPTYPMGCAGESMMMANCSLQGFGGAPMQYGATSTGPMQCFDGQQVYDLVPVMVKVGADGQPILSEEMFPIVDPNCSPEYHAYIQQLAATATVAQ